MLRNLANQAKSEKEELAKIDSWPELKFNNEDKSKLSQIELFSEILDTSVRIDVKATKKGQEDNTCIIPSQYFLYAIKIKSLAMNLFSYMVELDNIRNDGDKNNLVSIVEANNSSIPLFDHLDEYSRLIVLCPFNTKAERFGGKELINKPESGIKIRSNPDFFGSILLKVLHIPDESSSIIGKVIYQLCSNPEVYSYIEKRFIAQLPFIRKDKVLKNYVHKVFQYFNDYDGLSGFIDFKDFEDEEFSSDSSDFKSKNVFRLSKTMLSAEDLKSGENIRFHEEPLTYVEKTGVYVYLSNQWSDADAKRRTFINLKEIFEKAYPNYKLTKDDNSYKLLSANQKQVLRNDDTEVGATNTIYYGAPGTGKSHTINESIVEDYTVRTVFHADTQNSDFLGCLKPKMQGDTIGYEFRSGPFTDAVIKAFQEPSEQHWLVIEEINRAPAAAVFGEIFQLLDRESDGESTYSINLSDLDMIQHIESKTGKALDKGMLKIPSNLSLLATMNSSDQAVMPLDTAFKRRWNFKYIPLDFDKSYTESGKACSDGVLYIQDEISIDETPQEKLISWKYFAIAINEILTENSIPEDKHLGPFFLSDNELTDENRRESLTGKLFMYLWDDVLRHGMTEEVFSPKIKTYGQLTRSYQNKEAVFSSKFFGLVKEKLQPIEEEAPTKENGNDKEGS